MQILKPTTNSTLALASVLLLLGAIGCRSGPSKVSFTDGTENKSLATQNRTLADKAEPTTKQASFVQPQPHSRSRIDSPRCVDETLPADFANAPLIAESTLPEASLMLSLDQAIALSLQNAPVLRSLNAQAVVSPQVRTIYDPAIGSTDANFGIEAALSQFDANLTASLNHANNDDVFNNSILGGGATEVVQDLTTATFGLNKVAATGTRFAFDGNVIYDNNDNIASTFPSSYNAFLQAQIRQPLLQGRGVDFNRIAGPNSRPGFLGTSGYLVSRINNNISITQFERDIVRHVDEVVAAYWELYFSLRNFQTAKLAREYSLQTWNSVSARFENELPGGEADAEAEAREQYFQFEEEVTSTLNGNPARGITGVLQAEANLRRLIGMPQADDRLIRPADDPTPVATIYDWETLSDNALSDRVEIREQRLRIRQRELELLASKNFLLPRLDAIALFRNNGFGDRLVGGDSRFSSSLTDMASGDHNEWELGVQLDVPVGYRQANSGVRNSELQLMRERAILAESKQQILHQLGTALRQSKQTYRSAELNFNRMQAADDALQARLAAYEAGTVTVDRLLESVQRLADARNRFERSQTSHQIASAAIERESGTLLRSFGINLATATEPR